MSKQQTVFFGDLMSAVHQLRGEMTVSKYVQSLVRNEIERLGGEASLKVEMMKDKIAKLQAEIEAEEQKKVG